MKKSIKSLLFSKVWYFTVKLATLTLQGTVLNWWTIELLEDPNDEDDEVFWTEYKIIQKILGRFQSQYFLTLFQKCCHVLDHVMSLCTTENIKLKLLETLKKYVLHEFNFSCTKHNLSKSFIIFFIKNWCNGVNHCLTGKYVNSNEQHLIKRKAMDKRNKAVKSSRAWLSQKNVSIFNKRTDDCFFFI